MSNDCLSNVAKDYLDTFQQILDKMICGMTGAELGNSISYNFIVQMIPHHRAAIEMSENILRFTTNIELQEIAEQIVKEQTQSIADMEQIVNNCRRFQNPGGALNNYQSRINKIMQKMFRGMQQSDATNEINCDFISQMVPHHMGAVEMCQTTLAFPICQELRPILQSIITSQKRGIVQMQELWNCLKC